jgi:hypothetical protein
MPGFTAEAALTSSGKYYGMVSHASSGQRVFPQSRMTYAFKAGRLAGCCLSLGYGHQACMETAATASRSATNPTSDHRRGFHSARGSGA